VGQRRILVRAAELGLAALLGAVLALGGAAALGRLGAHTTVETFAAPNSAGQIMQSAPKGALTVNQIYRRNAPGVVQITSTSVVAVPMDPFFGDLVPQQRQEERSLGSGFVIDKEGHILTNYHVVQGAEKVKVSFSNGASLDAKIVGTDPSTDLAVIKVNAPERALKPLQLGDSDTVQVGDPVVAIGNPFGLSRTATAGIVSALQRPITAPNNFTIDHAIQTDAALNHGNSGGPLLDARGEVIGVNSQIDTGGTNQGNVGIGFAIPINTAKNVVAQILNSGKVEHAFLGIGPQQITPELARIFNLPVDHGLLVADVRAGTGAAKAGLKGGTTEVQVAGEGYRVGGDVIVRADGKPTNTAAQLRDILAGRKPGDKVKLDVYRGSKQLSVTVTLGRQPSSLTASG
jgi:S1-C subfamily serine protease